MEDVAEDNPVIGQGQKQRVGLGILGSVLPKARPAVRALGKFIPEEKQAASPASVLDLYGILNERFSEEWRDWEPETLWKEMSEIGVEVTDEIKNVVGALQVAVNTFFPFEAWHIFENTAHAFAGNDVNFSVVQPLELTEVAATIKILHEIRPKTEFDDEILGYIAAVAKNSGVVYLPPDLFLGAQQHLDPLNNNMQLKLRVKSVFPSVAVGDDELSLQTQKLAEIVDYVSGA